MISKNQIKFLNELKQKKGREEHLLFVAEGPKIVSELLSSAIRVKQIYSVPSAIDKLKIPTQVECIEIKPAELERISSLTTPNEMLAVCEIPHYTLNIEELSGKLTLLLDTIKDPGNMGTIIRIADWFGIETIICSHQSADVFNPKVIQATMGSITRVKIHYEELSELIARNQKQTKLPIYGALLEGENIYTQKLPTAAFILIGNESKGIATELIPAISNKITIPSFSHFKTIQGETESLNAAIATSIICSEFRRR
ncbi:MAG TPA: RNA methyltransferase [Bacteroidia bacterium]|nr:RNA methyltransferase [Bacteroidia bacterium]